MGQKPNLAAENRKSPLETEIKHFQRKLLPDSVIGSMGIGTVGAEGAAAPSTLSKFNISHMALHGKK